MSEGVVQAYEAGRALESGENLVIGAIELPHGAVLVLRVAGMLGIALIAAIVPEVGENRFWLAGSVAFVAVPAAIWLNLHFRAGENGWSEPLFDLLLIVTMIHLVPDMWYVALCIGLMVALAPSVGLHPSSHWIYTGFAALLLSGMVLAATVHDVDNWLLPILGVGAIYPPLIVYARWQALRANELRERSQMLQSLTHVAGSVAHDFNNTLMGVTGHAELALLELPETHPASESVSEIIHAAKRASLLCGQLLTFSGQNVTPDQAMDLKTELGMITALMEPVVPSGVAIRFHPAPGSYHVQGDRSQLQQVVMNIVLNAGEASTELPADVHIRLYKEKLNDAQWIVVEIEDSGSGIPEANLARIFDPFFTSKEKGHGLGLASTRRIMKAHGGSISVESEPGLGTCVTLRLLAHRPDAETAPDPSTGSHSRGGRILLVDDEQQVRHVAGRMLARLHYQVELARDADEAMAVFAERAAEFAGVILDLKMPGRDGWQCLRELREIRNDVPVIICSGYDPEQRQFDPGRAGVAYLSKPFRLAELQSVLNDLLATSIDVSNTVE